jgi:hypothetical protein
VQTKLPSGKLDKEREAYLLQSIGSIPSSCTQNIKELNQTLRTQLGNVEWLCVAPVVHTLKVLWSGQEPIDITVTSQEFDCKSISV